MQNEQKPSIPSNLLVLDILGVILLGVGIAKVFAGIDINPVSFRFDDYGLAFIVAGVALMLRYAVHVIRKSRTRIEEKRL